MSEDYTESYAQVLEETVIVRRYTGSGTSRPVFNASTRGRAVVYSATELVGTVQQGDQKVIVLVDDLTKQGLAMPLTNSDKVVVAGKELAIVTPLARKAPDGSLIAYELQARG